MTMLAWANGVHIAAMMIWLGGLIGLSWAVWPLPQRDVVVTAFSRFRWLAWAGMALILLTGFWRVGLYGGMKALPVFVHIKITLALVMILLGLLTTLWLQPRLTRDPGHPSSWADWLFLSLNLLTVLLGGVILLMLAQNGTLV